MNILSWTSKDCNWIANVKSLTVLDEQLWCVSVCVWGMYVENESLLPSLKDKENQDLKVAMNSVVVHSRFVDIIDELFIETCDFSFMG